MNGLLVRVGIDATAGHWNAPTNVSTREFVYVPIPESRETFHPGLERPYTEVEAALVGFGSSLPVHLKRQSMHLDPDFDHLTFGDQGSRGARIRKLKPGDFIVFFSSFLPNIPQKSGDQLIYAIMGFYWIEEMVNAVDVPKSKWHTNAHTRRMISSDSEDVIVFARRKGSGRLKHCLPIGEFRNRSYRVKNDILAEWNGLSVKDGYIQRSAVPPFFSDAEKFLKWYESQNAVYAKGNW